MYNINSKNKTIWDNAFVNVNLNPDVKTLNEDGEYQIAMPLNNDPIQQEFGAICDIIDASI